jgi:hypothetical protein
VITNQKKCQAFGSSETVVVYDTPEPGTRVECQTFENCESQNEIDKSLAKHSGNDNDIEDDKDGGCDQPHTELVIDASYLPLLSAFPIKSRQEIVLVTSPSSPIASSSSFRSVKRSPRTMSPLDLDFERIESAEYREPAILTKIRPLPSPTQISALDLKGQADTAVMADDCVETFFIAKDGSIRDVVHPTHSSNACVSCLKISFKGMITCCLGIFAP